MKDFCSNCSHHKVYLDPDDNLKDCNCTYNIQLLGVGHAECCDSGRFDGEVKECPYCNGRGEETCNDDYYDYGDDD